MIKLNLGCGVQTPDKWVNVDYAFGAWLFKIPGFSRINQNFKLFSVSWSNNILLHDLRKKLPWNDNSVDVVYSSHTLEHLSKVEGKLLLEECHRILKPNGVIRIVVPDLKKIVDSYERGHIDADDFLDHLHVGYSAPYDGYLKQKLAPFIRCPHKCMYDTSTLVRVISEVGFSAKSRSPFESEIEDINVIEKSSRTDESVIVEGNKLVFQLNQSAQQIQKVSV